MVKIYTYKYTQAFPQMSHSQMKGSAFIKSGCLLKIEFEPHLIGYADCSPWEILGDPSLEKQLNSLCQWASKNYEDGVLENIARQSLMHARLDAQARHSHHDLLAGSFALPNHKLIPNVLDVNPLKLDSYFESGFSTLKLKLGKDLDEELRVMQSNQSSLSRFQLRFDFNGYFKSSDEVKNFLEELPNELIPQIEFIEDAINDKFLYKELSQKIKIPLGMDCFEGLKVPVEGISVYVMKPARVNVIETLKVLRGSPSKVIITHYMGHPLERLSALSVALKAQFMLKEKLGVCGLLSVDGLKEEEVDSGFYERGPYIITPETQGGLGCDSYLSSLNWEALL